MTTPNTMRAVEITQHGGPEVLKIGTRPVPQPKAGEVLIKVAAAGVNRPDTMQRAGNYPVPPGASDIPGLELAGSIVATGEGVRDWRVGDMATALVQGGGYAEYCTAPAAIWRRAISAHLWLFACGRRRTALPSTAFAMRAMLPSSASRSTRSAGVSTSSIGIPARAGGAMVTAPPF